MNPTTFVAFYFCIDFKYALQTRSAGETRINDILKKLMKNSTDLARYSKKKNISVRWFHCLPFNFPPEDILCIGQTDTNNL